MLKRSGGINIVVMALMILNKLIEVSVAEKYSWYGKKQKTSFSTFKHIVELVMSSLHAARSEKGVEMHGT